MCLLELAEQPISGKMMRRVAPKTVVVNVTPHDSRQAIVSFQDRIKAVGDLCEARTDLGVLLSAASIHANGHPLAGFPEAKDQTITADNAKDRFPVIERFHALIELIMAFGSLTLNEFIAEAVTTNPAIPEALDSALNQLQHARDELMKNPQAAISAFKELYNDDPRFAALITVTEEVLPHFVRCSAESKGISLN